MFPLSTVLLPNQLLPLHVFEERYRALVADCLASEDPAFGVVLITRGSEVGGGDERASIGTLARITAAKPFDDGRWALLATGCTPVKVLSWTGEVPYPEAFVEELALRGPSLSAEGLERARASVARARALMSELGENTASSESSDEAWEGEELLWRLCALAPLPVVDKQRLLETSEAPSRLGLLCSMCDELAEEVGGFLGGRS